MSTTNLRKRLLAVEVRRLGGDALPPFFGFSFEDGGPGGDLPDIGPKSLEEYRKRYGCEPSLVFNFGYEVTDAQPQEATL